MSENVGIVIVSHSADVARGTALMVELMVGRQVAGIIWAIPQVGCNRAWLEARGSEFPVPVVLVGGMDARPSLASIAIDNRAIGEVATEHLLAGGAQRVGVITGPLTWWEAQQRLAGWRSTLEAHGMAADDRLVAGGDWTAQSGEDGLYALLDREPDLDAVFASNDQMAIGVLHGAHRLGRSIPDSLSVVGVDNIAESSHSWPPLTTVHQPLRDAGALAVRTIDELIGQAGRGRWAPETAVAEGTLLTPELIVRQSSRPVVASRGGE